jgi:DNA repair photolyase
MSYQAALPLGSLSASAPAERKPIDPPAALEPRLRRAARRGETVVLGTAEMPYEGTKETAALLRCEGLKVAVTTQSPAIVDEIDLLVELDRRSAVTVDMMLAAVDPFLVRRLEPGAADAKERLRAAARLASEGIAVRILCTPLRPGLNNREPALRALFAAACEAGAVDVLTAPAPTSRLARLFAGRRTPGPAGGDLAVFQRLRLEFGFPRAAAGRG